MIDFASGDYRRNPFPVYDQLRAAAPLLRDPRSGLWLLFDYAGVRQALTDHAHFSSSLFRAGRSNPGWLIFLDPPRHARLRSLISQAFTQRAVAELEPRIRQLSRELIRAVLPRGTMDLVSEYATPLPLMVVADLIGIPPEEWPRFRHWSDEILKLSTTITDTSTAPAAVAAYAAVKGEMGPWLAALQQERIAHPQDDLLTRLLEAQVDGERLTDQEIAGFVELLIVAGQETTSNLIANAMLCFAEYPGERARLAASPELLPSAIEEVLRFRSPVQWILRVTTSDVILHGQTVPAGQVVIPIPGAANRDPSVFAEPNRFDIARSPNPHLAFGHGAHFCIGAPLARLEARIALPDLFNRLANLELASAEPWEPRAALHVHGPARLEVRFTPGRPGPT
ncbi:MAG TPA: cytochrome P450 [Acidobacteriaceae bacterium]|nr:cytochrome P450 [Acidobacteriaceae bacterium]